MSEPELIESEVVHQLRTARPAAPEALRARVRGLAVAAPPRGRAWSLRRPLLVAVPAAVAGLAVAIGVGALRSDTPASEEAGGVARERPAWNAATTPAKADAAAPESSAAAPPRGAEQGAADASALRQPAAPAPSSARLQRYGAQLRVRVEDVDELSRATSRSLRIVRGLGGYVVGAQYGTPSARRGESVLVFRVPIGNVQQAIVRLTALGTLVAQSVQIQDLQAQFDRHATSIAALRRTIARLEALVADTSLAPERRADLELRLDNARRDLAARRKAHAATEREGRLARISLTLTAGDRPAKREEDGFVVGTLRGALHVLATALVWTAAALIVAGPFLGLAALALVLGRRRRRRGEERLLATS